MTDPTCPNCGAVVPGEAGFGMVMCQKCGELVSLTEPGHAGGGETFQDVVDFGNHEQPSPGFGALVYDIKIQGVDTVEIRKELLECLSDHRLQLDPQEILSQVNNGEIILTKINPVKASVILTRLRHLSLKISWASHQLIKEGTGILIVFLLLFLVTGKVYGADDLSRDESLLKNYATRINVTQNEIQELIKKKNQNHDATTRDKLLSDIVKKNQDLQGLYTLFRDEKQHILHEHPEQGDKTEHTYHHLKFKSLADLENESGLDGQLNRIKVKIDETYNQPSPSPKPTSTSKK